MNLFIRRHSAFLACLICAFLIALPLHAASKGKKKPTQPPGGANQVEGTHGKIGQMLFTGKWRFEVLAIQQADTYTMKVPNAEGDYAKYTNEAEFDSSTNIFTPKAGYTFISIDCLAKNGQTKTEQLDCYSDDQKTAVTDDQSNSYPPIAFDMITQGPWVTKPLLPGSSEKITILFAVPPGTKPQDLVMTLKNWSDHQGKEVRVTLSK
jgi:hypothetical protein